MVSIEVDGDVDECRQALRQRLGAVVWRSGGGYSGGHPFVGRVSGNFVEVRKCIKHLNSFAPIFYGRICPARNGAKTRIRGFFFIHPMVFLFSVFLVGVVVAGFIAKGDPQILFTMLPIFAVVILFCLWSARSHSSEIVTFLKEATTARASKESSKDRREPNGTR